MKVQEIIDLIKKEDLVRWNGEKINNKGVVFDDLVCAVRKRLRQVMDDKKLDNYALILNKSHIEIYPSEHLYEVDPIIIAIKKQVIKDELFSYFNTQTVYTFKGLELQGNKDLTFEEYDENCRKIISARENRLNNEKEKFIKLLSDNNIEIQTYIQIYNEFKKLSPSVKYDIISNKK